MRDIILSMEGIEITFPGVKALDKVNFSLARGEVHALLGENGAGKSTLIKCLTGVNHKDKGTIIFKGKKINPASPQEAMALGISTVFQEVNLCGNLSVAENIFIGRQPMRGGRVFWKEINRRAREILERFHVDIDVTLPLFHYSTAIQQIVSIARAVDVKADVLILDEPTSSLDESEVERLFAVVRHLKNDGMGVIFITHFLDQVFEISDYITVLRNGQLVGEYPAGEISKFDLVVKMIGKDMERIFDLRPVTLKPDAPVMLAADHIGAPGSVKDISLYVRAGEMLGFAGLLGSGRTETAELLFGVTPSATGSIKLRGNTRNVHSPHDAIRKKLAFCPENRKKDGIIGELTIRENIMLAVQARRGFLKPIARQEQYALADEYINLLGIATPNCEKKVGELSGGNQQKVILARWMATAPDVLILDEPTRGIDVGAKAEIQRLMLEMCENGVSVIFISSELEEVIRCANRILIMRDGQKAGELTGPFTTDTQNEILKTIAGEGRDDA